MRKEIISFLKSINSHDRVDIHVSPAKTTETIYVSVVSNIADTKYRISDHDKPDALVKSGICEMPFYDILDSFEEVVEEIETDHNICFEGATDLLTRLREKRAARKNAAQKAAQARAAKKAARDDAAKAFALSSECLEQMKEYKFAKFFTKNGKLIKNKHRMFKTFLERFGYSVSYDTAERLYFQLIKKQKH